MFSVVRSRASPSQGPAVLPRLLRPPLPAPPAESPFRIATRSISLRRPLPTSTQRCGCIPQPAVCARPTFRFPAPRNHHQRRSHGHRDQRRSFSHGYRHDPEYHASRLRSAKPLLTWRSFNTPSTYTVVVVAVAAGTIFYFSNLETVPVSGRTRFNVYGPESVRKAGEMEYRRLLYELESKGVRLLPDWDPRTVRVRRVMRRLIPFSGLADEEGDDWEVFVVDDPRTANAFVLPGGKVFVFSGILPLARNDSGLATVLGHEIAHNLAGHVGERLSQDIGASIVLYSLVILGGVFGLGPLIMHVFGSRFLDVAFGFPMSRLQESEADYIGLMMMAEACYDPAEAVHFWARMERVAGQDVPEWMSTHPTVSS